jgi:hypothetical protein
MEEKCHDEVVEFRIRFRPLSIIGTIVELEGIFKVVQRETTALLNLSLTQIQLEHQR